MSAKHFEKLAAEIKRDMDRANLLREQGDTWAHSRIKVQCQYAADIVCRVAEEFNERFNEARFLKACGLSD